MIILNRLTDSASQTMTLIGSAGENIRFALRYLPSIQLWQYSLGWGDFQVNGAQLVRSFNLLTAFQDIVPFGLACMTTDGLDPYYINDFVSGRVGLILLSQDEVNADDAAILDAARALQA